MDSEKNLVDDLIEKEPTPRPLDELPKTDEPVIEPTLQEESPSHYADDIFDPNIHRVDPMGIPIKTATGKYAKKRGRKPGSTNGPQQTTATPINDDSVQANQLGIATAETIFGLCQAIFGEEWTPIVDAKTGQNERQNMHQAWCQYYLLTGRRDLPPSMIVIVACTMYVAPRFQHENTRKKFGGIGGWILRGFQWAKSKLFKSRENEEGK